MTHVGILGCGWLGIELGRKLHEAGCRVSGSTRNKESHAELQAAGIQPFIVELEDTFSGNKEILDCDVLILAFPPGRGAEVQSRMARRIESLLHALESSTCRNIIMISSTSVYGPSETPVTEEDDREPEKESGRAVDMTTRPNPARGW